VPNKRDPDKRLLNVWVSREFYEIITKSAKKQGTNKSELARAALWQSYMRGEITDETQKRK
jgi:hypothetical protein